MNQAIKFALVSTLISFVSCSHAALLQWDLHGVTFDDGATAAGHFMFDTDLNQVTDFDIVASAGSKITTMFEYTPDSALLTQNNGGPGPGWPDNYLQFDARPGTIPGGSRELLLAFAAPLAEGDPISILYQGTQVGQSSFERETVGEHGPGTRLVIGPQVVDPPIVVPEPAQILCLAAGLALMGGMAARKRRLMNRGTSTV